MERRAAAPEKSTVGGHSGERPASSAETGDRGDRGKVAGEEPRFRMAAGVINGGAQLAVFVDKNKSIFQHGGQCAVGEKIKIEKDLSGKGEKMLFLRPIDPEKVWRSRKPK